MVLISITNYFCRCNTANAPSTRKATNEKTPAKIKLVAGLNPSPWPPGITKNKIPATNKTPAPTKNLSFSGTIGTSGTAAPTTNKISATIPTPLALELVCQIGFL